MSSLTAALIYLIACHGGPAAHFEDFAKSLKTNGYRVEIWATGPALDRLHHLDAKEFNPSHLDIEDPLVQRRLANNLAKSLQPALAVITDVGHLLMASVQESIARELPTMKRFAYYDNPEPFVPLYSQTASKVMACAQKVLFSNANLARETLYIAPHLPLFLPLEKRIGLGYYPLDAPKNLSLLREKKKGIVRQAFLKKHGIADRGQKIVVYFGGNNEIYFEQAFPTFLQILREAKLDPSRYLVFLQQHPGAKKKNLDRDLAQNQSLFISDLSSEEAQILADIILYFQTSMASQFVLAGIPVVQVAHETYFDLLIKNALAPSVTTSRALIQVLEEPPKQKDPAQLLEQLGIRSDWATQLENSFRF